MPRVRVNASSHSPASQSGKRDGYQTPQARTLSAPNPSLPNYAGSCAESCAEGRVSLQGNEPLDQIVGRILALRSKSAPVVGRSRNADPLISCCCHHRA